MGNSRRRLIAIKYIFLFIIFVDIYYWFQNNVKLLLVFWTLSLFIMINDYIRETKLEVPVWNYISLIGTIAGSAVLYYFAYGTGTEAYMFISLADIYKIRGRALKPMICIHAAIYFLALTMRVRVPHSMDTLQEYGLLIITYIGISGAFYLGQQRKIEQQEIRNLNEELTEANLKLREYSMKVEELAVTKERSRVAQELHDSLGHSLMALTMHLEFAKKVFDSKPDKAKEMLVKAEEISKDSINNLRAAVDTLKDNRVIKNLNNSIKELMNNFRLLSDIKINFKMDSNAEEVNADIKYCLFRTVQEALTNSIKHGRPTEINVQIEKQM